MYRERVHLSVQQWSREQSTPDNTHTHHLKDTERGKSPSKTHGAYNQQALAAAEALCKQVAEIKEERCLLWGSLDGHWLLHV